MKISDWLYRQVRKRAAFSHGGILHSDKNINDWMASCPNPHGILVNDYISLPEFKYERRTQKFWLIVLNKFFLTK